MCVSVCFSFVLYPIMFHLVVDFSFLFICISFECLDACFIYYVLFMFRFMYYLLCCVCVSVFLSFYLLMFLFIIYMFL